MHRVRGLHAIEAARPAAEVLRRRRAERRDRRALSGEHELDVRGRERARGQLVAQRGRRRHDGAPAALDGGRVLGGAEVTLLDVEGGPVLRPARTRGGRGRARFTVTRTGPSMTLCVGAGAAASASGAGPASGLSGAPSSQLARSHTQHSTQRILATYGPLHGEITPPRAQIRAGRQTSTPALAVSPRESRRSWEVEVGDIQSYVGGPQTHVRARRCRSAVQYWALRKFARSVLSSL